MTVLLGLASASAPASIGNVGVGFDILGQSFNAARDLVTAQAEAEPGVRLGRVDGLVDALPAAVSDNTALAAAASLLAAAGAPTGVRLSIRKGVPLSAGMGGSAASAVAAVVAVNALLGAPFSDAQLLLHALVGEGVAADPPPWDNVIASLYGGLVLAAREAPPSIRRLPVPPGIVAILFHPDRRVETRAARALLATDVPMKLAVEHSRRVAAFVAGCCLGDLALVRAGLEDLLVEPQRRHLLPCLPDVQAAARQAGALGCSFSGSGPSVFAWAESAAAASVEAAMAAAFAAAGQGARAYRAPVCGAGARVESRVPARAAA